MLLNYKEETKQPCCPIAGLSAPWVLSSAGKLFWNLHRSYFVPYRKPSFVSQTFSSSVFITISIFLSSLSLANIRPVRWTLSPPHHEQTRPLMLICYKFVLVLGPTLFLYKAFLKKNTNHTLNCIHSATGIQQKMSWNHFVSDESFRWSSSLHHFFNSLRCPFLKYKSYELHYVVYLEG